MRPEPFAWTTHPEALVGLAALVLAYGAAARRHPPSRWRVVAFAGALLLLLAVAVSPLESLSFHLLSAHLLQNVILAEWAPALLVLAVPPVLAAELARVPAFAALVRPTVALPLWLVTYFLWHLPPAYDTALAHPHTLLHLEHASYLVAGIFLWWPVLQDPPWRMSDQGRAAYLFGAFVFASPLGLLLALLPDAVYSWYDAGFERWGLSALRDQQIAGVTMAGEQAIVFFAAFAFYFLRFLGEEDRGTQQL